MICTLTSVLQLYYQAFIAQSTLVVGTVFQQPATYDVPTYRLVAKFVFILCRIACSLTHSGSNLANPCPTRSPSCVALLVSVFSRSFYTITWGAETYGLVPNPQGSRPSQRYCLDRGSQLTCGCIPATALRKFRRSSADYVSRCCQLAALIWRNP